MMAGTSEGRRRNPWLALVVVAIVSSLLTFGVTWALTSSRAVSVTFVNPNTSTSAAATPLPTTALSVNPATSGQLALTDAELRSAVKTFGVSVYWAGFMPGALYTFNHLATGQNFVRYLPNGNGLADLAQNYRVIGTYVVANAYQTMQIAGKLSTGVGATNPDGSIIYYAKATPLHVYLAFKGVPLQIEIFDPTPGVSLKLAKTPGIIKTIL